MPRTVLHVGAHKTATTFLQRTLTNNIDLLKAANVHYLPLDVLRKNFTNHINDSQRTEIGADLVARIGRQDVLISDENLSGAPADLVRNGTYYPNVGKRIEALLDAIRTRDVEVVFAVREYAAFHVSMYCEYLRHRDFMKFGEYHALFGKSKFNWNDVVADLVALVPQERLTIIDFSDFRNKQNAVLQLLSGLPGDRFALPTEQVRESFSSMTVQALETLSTIMRPDEVRKAVNGLSRAYSKSDGYAAYDPMSADEKAACKTRYADDLAAMKARFSKVRFM